MPTQLTPLATRAVYSFWGFAARPPCHLYLHHDGYPTGAAWRFAAALRETAEPQDFLSSFLSTQTRAEQLTSPHQAADAEYRYRVQLVSSPEAQVAVQWQRRLPRSSHWQQSWGPVPLPIFIQRFLPGDTPACARAGM